MTQKNNLEQNLSSSNSVGQNRLDQSEQAEQTPNLDQVQDRFDSNLLESQSRHESVMDLLEQLTEMQHDDELIDPPKKIVKEGLRPW